MDPDLEGQRDPRSCPADYDDEGGVMLFVVNI